jgi:sulfur carrier protein ThiS
MITVRLPQKKTELEVPGPRRVMDLLAEAGMSPTLVSPVQFWEGPPLKISGLACNG